MKLCWDWNLFWRLSHIIPKISSSFPAPWAREGMQHKPQRRRRLLTAPKNWRHLVWFPSLNFSATTWFLLLNHHKSFKGDTCFSEICHVISSDKCILWNSLQSLLKVRHVDKFTNNTLVPGRELVDIWYLPYLHVCRRHNSSGTSLTIRWNWSGIIMNATVLYKTIRGGYHNPMVNAVCCAKKCWNEGWNST